MGRGLEAAHQKRETHHKRKTPATLSGTISSLRMYQNNIKFMCTRHFPPSWLPEGSAPSLIHSLRSSLAWEGLPGPWGIQLIRIATVRLMYCLHTSVLCSLLRCYHTTGNFRMVQNSTVFTKLKFSCRENKSHKSFNIPPCVHSLS